MARKLKAVPVLPPGAELIDKNSAPDRVHRLLGLTVATLAQWLGDDISHGENFLDANGIMERVGVALTERAALRQEITALRQEIAVIQGVFIKVHRDNEGLRARVQELEAKA